VVWNVRLSREDWDVESPIPRVRRPTLKVMGRWSAKTVDVRADGMALSSRAGPALLAPSATSTGKTARTPLKLSGLDTFIR
jgi:hypothetical protein